MSSISFLHLSLVPYRIALFVFLALDIAVLYYVLDLLIFHIRLTIEGNTTCCIAGRMSCRYTHFKKLDAKEKQKREEAKSRQSSHDSIQSEFLLPSSHIVRLSQGDLLVEDAGGKRQCHSRHYAVSSVPAADSQIGGYQVHSFSGVEVSPFWKLQPAGRSRRFLHIAARQERRERMKSRQREFL